MRAIRSSLAASTKILRSAAVVALAGYLRAIGWPHNGMVNTAEEMNMRSRLRAEIPSPPGHSIRISGTARIMLS
jgi:hypothetical protein